jgi:hypothetical protein
MFSLRSAWITKFNTTRPSSGCMPIRVKDTSNLDRQIVPAPKVKKIVSTQPLPSSQQECGPIGLTLPASEIEDHVDRTPHSDHWQSCLIITAPSTA